MTDLLTATDNLNEARRLVQAAQMAALSIGKTGSDIDDEKSALDSVLYTALRKFETGLDIVEKVRLGKGGAS